MDLIRAAGLGVALLLLAATPASATIRYAAPGGTADDSQCIIATATDTSPTPCSIYEAAGYFDPGNAVTGADEVVIAPGNYSDTAGDLGPFGRVSPLAQNVHGASGKPRPKITLNSSSGGFGAFNVGTGGVVSDVEILAVGRQLAITNTSGTIERVIARASAPSSTACQHALGTYRDSVCIATGSNSTAIGAPGLGIFQANHTVTLRNVTAIASGTGSFGINYDVLSSGGTYTVNARAVIAQGTSADVRAEQAQGVAVAINLDFSNYSSTSPNGGATITAVGADPDNQTAEPVFAADGYHQDSSSPTINAGGAPDGSTGTADIDGNLRHIDAFVDIGADEFARATSTLVSCTPMSQIVGNSTTCTATVTDTGGVPTVPTGSVGFSSTGTGTFSAPSCGLAATGDPGEAECQLTYTPTQVGSGTHTISGDYLADATHTPSSGSTPLTVQPLHTTNTSVSCVPASVTIGADSADCTATVTDTNGGSPTTPTGNVSFGTDGAGNFSLSGSCALAPTMIPGQASCMLTYTPSAVSTGTHQITGTYGGDAAHATSQGSTPVTVAFHPTTSSVSCTPSSLLLGSGSTTCTATITDTSGSPTKPTGTVSFSAGTGTFGGGGGCALVPAANPAAASCQVTYTPEAAGAAQINGSYGGDTTHAASQGAATLTVLAPSTVPTPPATTPVPPRKKCKQGRKLVRRKGKLRCVKKTRRG